MLSPQVLTNWGSRVYPVSYSYDSQGRRKTLTTWTNFASQSGAATTTWNYDTNRGFLLSKVYADGKGTTNSYTPAGRLRTRAWARGVTTTYHTNAAGDIVATTYSDSTPAVTNNLDRLGRVTNVVDGTGSRLLVYNDAGRLTTDTTAAGTLAGLSLSNNYDALLRRTGLAFRTNTGAPILSYSYGYDAASRLTNVNDGTYSASYSYLANSPLVSQLTFRSNSATRMTTSKSYDYLNRLQRISSTDSSSANVGSFDYSYNDANQRTRMGLGDGSYWIYEYDGLGQVISGKHYWSDGTPVAGQQFEYSFDDIGNRLATKSGGDETGANLRSAAYAANSLNQYTARDVPGYLDVVGVAHANASVTVNDQSPYRRGEYYRQELSVSNGSAALWQGITNIAALTGTNQTNTGSLFLPKSQETFAYDADGNLTNDGRFRYVWDAENRITLAESQTSAPSASKRKVSIDYDGGGRMVRRVEYDGGSGSYVQSSDIKFARDGWQIIAEINGSTGQRLRSYIWGLDLSGSLTGASGVGGLLAVNSASAGTHFCVIDGNGNVVAMVSGIEGSRSAAFEFDPFGQTLRRSGSAVTENLFRFSTKRADDTLDLISYEYRGYNPSAGRWLSRDPIGERAGVNLSGFINNNTPSSFDKLGGLAFNLGCLCFCKCQTPQFRYDPGGSSFDFGWHPADPKERYGSDVTVTWSVLGNPKKCTYTQSEEGTMIGVNKTTGDTKSFGFDESRNVPDRLIKYNQASCSGTAMLPKDHSGIFLANPADAGVWDFVVDMIYITTCTGTDGDTVVGFDTWSKRSDGVAFPH